MNEYAEVTLDGETIMRYSDGVIYRSLPTSPIVIPIPLKDIKFPRPILKTKQKIVRSAYGVGIGELNEDLNDGWSVKSSIVVNDTRASFVEYLLEKEE